MYTPVQDQAGPTQRAGRATIGWQLFLLLTAFVLVVTLTPGRAWAASAFTDNMMPTRNWNYTCTDTLMYHGANCQTDNDNVGWRAERSIDTTAASDDTKAEKYINMTMANSYDGTDLSVHFDTTPVYSGSGETDIIYRSKPEDFRKDDFIGMTWCDDAVSALRCDQQYINFRYVNQVNRALACHETGHAVGLTHGRDAYPRPNSNLKLADKDERLNCMVTPLDADLRFIGDNNVANINSTYPN